MTKHVTILRLIDQLRLDDRGWVIVDHWEADLCAVGIAHAERPRHLVYVCSFGLPEGRYDYQCEAPAGEKAEEYSVADRGENVDFDRLVRIMEQHLAPAGSGSHE